MTKRPYTQAELKRFDRLTDKLSSPKQMDRISAGIDLRKFIKEHGKEKCDLMFAELKARDAGRK